MALTAKAHLHRAVLSHVNVSEEDAKIFLNRWEELAINKNEYLIKEGELEQYLYFVHEGVLRIYVLSKGEEQTLGFSYDGFYSGGYDSFCTNKPSELNVVAVSPCILLRIHKKDLHNLYDNFKIWERYGRLLNEEFGLGLAKQQIYLLTMSSEERFVRFMNDSAHLMQLVPQKYIASYLGMTPETFSRLRAKE